jgi:hypothetical protein
MVTKQLQKAFIYNQHNCVLKADTMAFTPRRLKGMIMKFQLKLKEYYKREIIHQASRKIFYSSGFR